MKFRIVQFILLLSFVVVYSKSSSQSKTIHVFVALCDNEYQGIVPVSATLGNGKDPARNLYWGAAYGVKTFFKYKNDKWELVTTLDPKNELILDRVLFKHLTDDVYLLADAYDGEHIDKCIEDFLLASNGQVSQKIIQNSLTLHFGGASSLVAYVGHDGLMEFNLDLSYEENPHERKDAIILACYSKNYFKSEVELAQANALIWTTHLMAPEAYTLSAAIEGWLMNEDGEQIAERTAQAYNKYQKCGIRGARNLFTTGF